MSGQRMRDTILVGRGSCYGWCSAEGSRSERAVPRRPCLRRPQFETIGSLGSLCNVGDLKAIALANQLCAAYNIDTISTGTTIAFAMECFEKGILTTADTGGIELAFGDADVMVQVVRADREAGKGLAICSRRA